jgi:hypothetical protein
LIGVRFNPFAPAPQHENLRAKLRAQIHRAQRLLHGAGAHLRVIGGKRAIPKDRIIEKIYGRHRHDDARLFARGAELTHDPVALCGRGVNRDEIIVVKVDAPRAYFGKHPHGVYGRKRRANCFAERVAPAIGDSPQPEAELMLRSWRVFIIRHDSSPFTKGFRARFP